MGYTTTFDGAISINPPVSPALRDRINRFCEERHGGPMYEDPGCPSFWCDWTVAKTGDEISWNGSEKSYGMEKWLPILIEKFFKPRGHVLNGSVDAFGESPGDVWRIKVKDNVVVRCEGRMIFEEERKVS